MQETIICTVIVRVNFLSNNKSHELDLDERHYLFMKFRIYLSWFHTRFLSPHQTNNVELGEHFKQKQEWNKNEGKKDYINV